MDQEIINSIEQMAVSGNRLQLPTEMLTNYPQVKKVLVAAGGVYKKNGFDFLTDAQAIKDRLTGGEAINDKKKYQQFFTPPALAQKLFDMSEPESHHSFLEPSAGQAAIASIMKDNCEILTLVEIDPVNVKWLRDNGWCVVHDDFLKLNPDEFSLYDRIIANPPFTNNQDIDHIRHMYSFLKPGGVLVSLSSPSWTFTSYKKAVAFREWLDDLGAVTEVVQAGEFKESGTNIRTVIIKITKPV